MTKKQFYYIKHRLLAGALIVGTGVVPWQHANAERLFNENFDYPTGNLYQQGGWLRFFTNNKAPIQVLDGNLTYEGYEGTGIGGKVELGIEASGEDLFKTWTDPIKEGDVYISFLLNVKDVNSSKAYFFALLPQNKAGDFGDGKQVNEYMKCYVREGSQPGTYNFGISRTGAITTAVYANKDLVLGETALVVLKYSIVPGSSNDNMVAWVNPAISAIEPSAADIDLGNSGGEIPAYGIYGVELRQGATSSNKAANVEIDALRAGTQWSDLYDELPGSEAPVIAASSTELNLNTFQGMPVTGSVKITGQDLTDDIAINCPEGVTCNRTTVSKDEAMSEEGAEVVFEITPENFGLQNYVVRLTSADAVELNVNINVQASPCTQFATAAELTAAAGNPSNLDGVYRFTGKGVVTFVEKGQYGSYNVYLQDATGGMKMSVYSETGDAPYQVGDEISGGIGVLSASLGAPCLEIYYANPVVEATGKTAEPIEVAVDAINKANAKDYIYRLVSVKGVTLSDVQEGSKFAVQNYTFGNGTATAVMRPFAGTDLLGTDIPAGKINLTGISTSASQFTLAPRSLADVEAAAATPSFSLSQTIVRLDNTMLGVTQKQTLTLTASDLEGDITITCPATITCDKTVITKEEAMAEGGVQLVFAVTPDKAGEYDEKVTFASEGAQNVDVSFSIREGTDVVMLPNSTRIMAELDNPDYEANIYKYTGKAVVTYIENATSDYGSDYFKVYAQDMHGGMCISMEYAVEHDMPFKVGDEISNMYGIIQSYLGAPVFYLAPVSATLADITAEGKTKSPVEVRLADITPATASEYIYRLVKVNDVTFQPAGDVTKFSTANVSFTDGEKTAVARPFGGSDLVGTEIPTGEVSLQGISLSVAQLTLGLRSASDIEAGAAGVQITPEKLFDFTDNAAAVGEETEIYKFTVKADNLKVPAPVLLTGDNADYFTVDPAQIPSGSGTTVVTVYYHPETIGMHRANIMFDFDGTNSEYNYTASLGTCKAYDPENMPQITVTPANIELVAAPGEKVTATVNLTATGCFDYITGKRGAQGDNGGITINNTYLLPDSKDVPLVITFQPKAEGEYTETFTYTTSMCATPATITVTAVCSGSVPPAPTEGQPFELSTDNAQAFYTQSFANVEHNKPVAIEGWTNSALEGQRAWWGYAATGDDAFYAAKCTAYDSNIAAADAITNQQMILVSPALDYANAKSKMLKFRLMGQFLTENSGDLLEICLVEPDGEGYGIYPMDGFAVPSTEEESGEWIPYEVDMSVVPDMPDVFFIGFRFNYTRSNANATTYYITDFQWGDKTQSVDGIISDGCLYGARADADGKYSVYNMQGIRVLRAADASDMERLPSGIYIVGGIKVRVK